jgi:hypothetical protein
MIILTVAVLLGLTSLSFDVGFVGKVNAGTQQVADAVTLVAAPQLGGAGWQGGGPVCPFGSDG